MKNMNLTNPAGENMEVSLCSKELDKLFPKGRKAYIHSFGCQQNVSDGEHISGIVQALGFSFTDEEDDAELIIYNTCAVRETAETKVLGHIGALKALKQRKKNMLIIICGCMTQRKEMQERIKKSYPFVDIVFGTNNLKLIPRLISRRLSEGKRIFHSDIGTQIEEGLPIVREDSFKAYLPIMQGCDNFCSYCIVPYVKGREMSRRPQDIIDEAEALVKNGCREITLLGTNVNSYGKKEGYDFPKLLKAIDELDGDFFLSFMTSHPKDCTKELIDVVAQSRHICHHLHLPVQSGSNEILKRMNRSYTVEKYLSLIDYARSKMADVSFSSDIIVGFPNESDKDFADTLSLIEKVRYNALFTFIYSKRSGTPAAIMEDEITHREKAVRMNRLLKIQQRISHELNSEKVGRQEKVLFDSYDSENRLAVGRTGANILTLSQTDTDVTGKMCLVTIKEAMSAQIKGVIDIIY